MDTLSQTFQALADPTRRALLARLATGAATVGELAEPFDMSLPAVSRHLRVLTDAGLIERHTEAQWRRCELRGEGFRAALVGAGSPQRAIVMRNGSESEMTSGLTGAETDIMTKGRHDPCVGIRAVPVGEAMMACVLADHFLRHRGQVG